MRAMAKAVVTAWHTGLSWRHNTTRAEIVLQTVVAAGGNPVCEKLTLETEIDGTFLRIVDRAMRDRKIVKITFEITEEVRP